MNDETRLLSMPTQGDQLRGYESRGWTAVPRLRDCDERAKVLARIDRRSKEHQPILLFYVYDTDARTYDNDKFAAVVNTKLMEENIVAISDAAPPVMADMQRVCFDFRNAHKEYLRVLYTIVRVMDENELVYYMSIEEKLVTMRTPSTIIDKIPSKILGGVQRRMTFYKLHYNTLETERLKLLRHRAMLRDLDSRDQPSPPPPPPLLPSPPPTHSKGDDSDSDAPETTLYLTSSSDSGGDDGDDDRIDLDLVPKVMDGLEPVDETPAPEPRTRANYFIDIGSGRGRRKR